MSIKFELSLYRYKCSTNFGEVTSIFFLERHPEPSFELNYLVDFFFLILFYHELKFKWHGNDKIIYTYMIHQFKRFYNKSQHTQTRVNMQNSTCSPSLLHILHAISRLQPKRRSDTAQVRTVLRVWNINPTKMVAVGDVSLSITGQRLSFLSQVHYLCPRKKRSVSSTL